MLCVQVSERCVGVTRRLPGNGQTAEHSGYPPDLEVCFLLPCVGLHRRSDFFCTCLYFPCMCLCRLL